MAFGYWDQPALTAQRFLVGDDGVRTVRTGDHSRFRPDGQFEHLGRLDRQVKVHGQSVDLASIERRGGGRLPRPRCGGLVGAHDDGGHRVVAHVVLDAEGVQTVTVAALRRVPRHPAAAVPRSPARSPDQRRAADAHGQGRPRRPPRARSARSTSRPTTSRRGTGAGRRWHASSPKCWPANAPTVGVRDDFFELGGDSLSPWDLHRRLTKEPAGAVGDRPDPPHDRRGCRRPIGRAGRRAGRGARPRQRRRRTNLVLCSAPPAPRSSSVPRGTSAPTCRCTRFTYRGIERHRALPDLSVTAIAAQRRRPPPGRPGSYRLFGYSFGGAVALVMAQQLTASGADVELLALLEPTLWSSDAWRPKNRATDPVRDTPRSTTPGRDVTRGSHRCA